MDTRLRSGRWHAAAPHGRLAAPRVILGMLLVLVFAGGPAAAQQSTQTRLDGLALDSDQPIQIASDRLEINDETNTATFSGNVEVVQGDTLLKSGRMVVHYAGGVGARGAVSGGAGDIDRIEVSGTVYLKSGEQEATADAGTFDLRSEIFTLTGEEVVLTEGPNVFIGCKLTVRMATSEAKLESCGDRVMIQLDPGSRPNQ